MKTWEIIKLLEEGKKVRKDWWEEGTYIQMYFDMDRKEVLWDNGEKFETDDLFLQNVGEWEIYEETEEDIKNRIEETKKKQYELQKMLNKLTKTEKKFLKFKIKK